jgi:hypothetical protein
MAGLKLNFSVDQNNGISPPYHEQIITLEKLRKALENTVGQKGISNGDIEKLSEYLMNFFGFSEYVIDNMLNSEDRDVFYMLEEEGLLKTSREEISLLKGKVWRIHYWILKKKEILEYASLDADAVKTEEDFSIYQNISDDVWSREHI